MCRQHSHCLSVARATYCTQLHCHPCVVTAGQEVHPQHHCHELWRDVSPDENRISTMPLGNILAPPEPHGSPTIGAAHRSPSTATRQVGETPGYSLRPHPSGPPFSAVSTPGQGRVGEGELGGGPPALLTLFFIPYTCSSAPRSCCRNNCSSGSGSGKSTSKVWDSVDIMVFSGWDSSHLSVALRVLKSRVPEP